MHFSFVVYARALITRASRFFSPLETHIWQSRVGSLTPLLNVTHSLAYDPCNRVFHMRINNNTGICQCAQANLTNYVLHFRVVCLSIYLNPSIRLSGRSLPSVRTRMERHRIAEIIERQHQHQIPAPSTQHQEYHVTIRRTRITKTCTSFSRSESDNRMALHM